MCIRSLVIDDLATNQGRDDAQRVLEAAGQMIEWIAEGSELRLVPSGAGSSARAGCWSPARLACAVSSQEVSAVGRSLLTARAVR